jgi:large subunit ribosomal protein L19
MDALRKIEQSSIKEIKYYFNVGDTVKVNVGITEGGKSRIQVFEGTVISKTGSGVSESFTVRKVSSGIGVERIFPLNSPNLHEIKVVRKGKVRRSKLYYLRERIGKSAKVKEKLK